MTLYYTSRNPLKIDRRNSPAPSSLSEPPPAARPSREPAPFLCTFCWQTYDPPLRPKLLGHEKRTCCVSCYNQLLDLAICWVCGELVVRGDEVVSLGWCFWHRGCFGCLICSQPISVPDQVDVVDRSGEVEKKSGNRLKDEIDTVKRKRKRKHAAVELDEVPVCHGCEGLLIETGPHREEVETFLGRSNVNQHDGGLGEQRWERIKNSLSEELTEYAQPSKARRLASLFEDSSKGSGDASSGGKTITPVRRVARRRTTNDATISYDSSNSMLGRDGSQDTHPDESFDPDAYFPRMPRPPPPPLTPPPANPIYVSVLDPINGPSFRPSPTKPIPRWMALLPSSQTKSPTRSRLPSNSAADSFDSISLESDVEEHVTAPQSSPSTEHPSPIITPSHASLPTIPEGLRASPRRFAPSNSSATANASEMTVYFTPPEHPCDFFQKAMEKRQITDLAGVKNLERSLKKGSLQPGHTAFHRRGQSSATECLDKPALPPIKIPIDTKKVLPPPFVSAVSASAKTEVKGRVKSSAEFVERYQLARKEESARSRERARSVRGSLERVRGRGSVRSVVGRAKKNAAAAESAKASATSTQAPTPTGEAGETVVEETGKEKLRRELRGIFERR